MEEIARQSLKELRLLIFELRPLVLQQMGLVQALQQRLKSVEQRAGIRTRLLSNGNVKVPEFAEDDLFRIAMEALNNSLKHATATEVAVRIKDSPNEFEMEISDDGKGFDLEEGRDTWSGLQNMQERARKISADFQINSTLGSGTTISVRLEV